MLLASTLTLEQAFRSQKKDKNDGDVYLSRSVHEGATVVEVRRENHPPTKTRQDKKKVIKIYEASNQRGGIRETQLEDVSRGLKSGILLSPPAAAVAAVLRRDRPPAAAR
ncbi:predicted protein [Histoplasma capsulatum var. duboisii H88]|uniref:Predicted protein n=1 Tax=Ajellomyces capsulatus (strain H88) TaxID=544711 RepID=F0URG3_AJEC8|nr:predicted protein [Histoplasma capsulatum var. duboisii H88]